MANPYAGKAEWQFWRDAVSECPLDAFDPVVASSFSITPAMTIATAGSCFAQHISRTLVADGYNFLITEKFESFPGTTDENYGAFPARFGNVYSTCQLLQLFDRAFGTFNPKAIEAHGKHGGHIDLARPTIQSNGFESIEALLADRERHLASVRRMFEILRRVNFHLGPNGILAKKI